MNWPVWHLRLSFCYVSRRMEVNQSNLGLMLSPLRIWGVSLRWVSLIRLFCLETVRSFLSFSSWLIAVHCTAQVEHPAGGTFSLRGVSSPIEYLALCTVLRVGVYTHLSLLEQYFLLDSAVSSFPAPEPAPAPISPLRCERR